MSQQPPPENALPFDRLPDFPLSPAAAEIETLIRARYSLLGVFSAEEERAMLNLMRVAENVKKSLYEWTISRGLMRYRLNSNPKADGRKGTKDPLTVLRELPDIQEPAIIVLKDFQPYLKESAVRRSLRDLSQWLRHTSATLILLSRDLEIPKDLQKEITLVDFPPPGRAELADLLLRMEAEIAGDSRFLVSQSPDDRAALLDAALGLTLVEAENVFAKALVTTGRLTSAEVPYIFAEKRQIIRKSGLLEYIDTAESIQSIGGLDRLKQWLVERRLAFTERAREFGLPTPKGVLFTGVQGCGKSLCAKAVATLYAMPLLRLDMGSVFGSYVGESESQIRHALALAQSVSPCVLWIDEIDKGLAGLKSAGSGDSGTTQRVFGTLVTWMQENRAPVFTVATANNIEFLPPEVLRKGRFDEIFFVDLPDTRARQSIFAIQLLRLRRDPRAFELDTLGEITEGFSGAEIEACVVAGLFRALNEGREIETGDLVAAATETVPLSRTMREEIDRIRKWADGRARPAA